MATIAPTVEVHGNSTLVKWTGFTTGDIGQEVDLSGFRLITVQMQSTGGGQMRLEGSSDTTLNWVTLTPSNWSGGASNFIGQITDRFRWIRVITVNGTVTTGDVVLWCVN